MTLNEIWTDIKLGVLIFVAFIFVDIILGWTCETEYWRTVAEAFKNLGGGL